MLTLKDRMAEDEIILVFKDPTKACSLVFGRFAGLYAKKWIRKSHRYCLFRAGTQQRGLHGRSFRQKTAQTIAYYAQVYVLYVISLPIRKRFLKVGLFP
jgi:hypothetical protein